MDWGTIDDVGDEPIWASSAPLKPKKMKRGAPGGGGMKPSKRDTAKGAAGKKKGILKRSSTNNYGVGADDDESSVLMFGDNNDGGDSVSLMQDDASTAWEMGSLFEGQQDDAISTDFEPVVYSDWGDFGASVSNMSVNSAAQDKALPKGIPTGMELNLTKKDRKKKKPIGSHVSLASGGSEDSKNNRWGPALPGAMASKPVPLPPQDLSFKRKEQKPAPDIWSKQPVEEPVEELWASSKPELAQKKKKKKKNKKGKRSSSEKSDSANESGRSSKASSRKQSYTNSPDQSAVTDDSSPEAHSSFLAAAGRLPTNEGDGSIAYSAAQSNTRSSVNASGRSTARSTHSAARSSARSTSGNSTGHSTAMSSKSASAFSRDDYIQQLILLQTQQAAVANAAAASRDGSDDFQDEFGQSAGATITKSKSVDTLNSRGTQLSRDTRVTQNSENPAVDGRPAEMFQASHKQNNDDYVQALMTGKETAIPRKQSTRGGMKTTRTEDPLEDRNITVPVGHQNFVDPSSTNTRSTMDAMEDRSEMYLPKSALKNSRGGLPITMEMTEKPKKSSKRRLCALIAVVLVVAVVSVVLFIVLKPKEEKPTETEPEPTSSGGYDEFYLELFVPLSGSNALADPESPQYKGAMWMSARYGAPEESEELTEEMTQEYAIAALHYSLTFGEESTSLDGWLDPDKHVCEWSPGIVCDTSGGVVIALSLKDRGLEGYIAEELQHLTSLRTVVLSNNTLVGQIPPIGNLKQLQHFEVERSKLSGAIPADIEALVELTSLDFSRNFLTSTIPTQLFSLSSLEYVNFSFNKLRGEMSKDFTLLTRLRVINLRNNRLTSSLPNIVGGLDSLEDLIVDFNDLSGTIPEHYEFLGRRRVMTSSNNLLSGTIPHEVPSEDEAAAFEALASGIFKLTTVDISNNLISGVMPALIAVLPALTYFDFSRNMFEGAVPGFFGSKVTHLDGSDNFLNGTLPNNYGSKLQFINFKNNSFEGTIPDRLWSLTDLKHFDASMNQGVTGTLASAVAKATSLEHLNLSNCSLTGSLPTEMTTMGSTLEVVLLNDNQITGSLPSEIGLMSSLRLLDLSSNQILGSLPEEMGELSNLELLGLHTNSLTGEIPFSFSSMTSLTTAMLQDNALIGEWPVCINNQNIFGTEGSNYTVDCAVNCICCNTCIP